MAKKHPTIQYENNPFNIGLSGIKLLFTNAQSVAIYAVVITVVGFIANLISSVIDVLNDKPESTAVAIQQAPFEMSELLIGGVIVASIGFVFIVLLAWLYGTLEYTGAQLAQDKKVVLGQALKEVAKQLASYLWVLLIIGVKVFLWSLLLIVPGIIMAVRYSLATTAFFAEGKHGNAAIKRSLELTKGAWLTTFAGTGLWNLLTLGQASAVIQPGVNAVLFRQLKDATDNNIAKPEAHWLSWLTLIVPIVLFMLWIAVIALILVVYLLTR